MDKERLRVGVVFGGRSGEHEVSIMSAASVIRALDPERYAIIPIYITREGRWLRPESIETAFSGTPRGRFVTLPADPTVRGLIPVHIDRTLEPSGFEEVDVIVPVLHGPYGEDGTLQGLLEMANIPYVGAGVLASAVAMDKAVMKDLFVFHGLPTVAYKVVSAKAWREDPARVLEEVEADLGYPCFVKPVNLGSSVGIHKCAHREELRAGLTDAARFGRKLIVEEAVHEAREIEVSVLGNEEIAASIPGEVVPSREFYDYRAKYLDNASELRIPAPLDQDRAEECRSLALAAFRALDCEGMARVDFFLSGTGKLYVNEINTIPGFTRISMYAKLWEASGLAYSQLLDRLIELGLERWREKQSLTTFIDIADEESPEEEANPFPGDGG